MEVNGIAHVMLTVSDFDSCLPFYEQLLGFLGLRPVLKADGMLYCVGGRTAVGIVRAEDRWCDERFAQLRVGLHHVCFRARRASRSSSAARGASRSLNTAFGTVPSIARSK